MAEKPKIPASVLKFFKAAGAQGGNERAKRYSAEQLAEWGRKGGRPRKAVQDTNVKQGGK